MKNVFKNHDAFYNMVLSTTIMSNSITSEFENDAKEIIGFIGKAYGINDDLIFDCCDIILNRLMQLGLIADQRAVYGGRSLGNEYSDDDILMDIKVDVLTKLQSMTNIDNIEINPNWFDYTHYKTYQADIRFSALNTTSAGGNLIATRQVGILQTLGIGCPEDKDAAIKRFIQCVFWGDIPSMYFLSYTYLLAGNDKKSKLFYELASLCSKYLNTGCTVLPDEVKNSYSEESRTYYAYVSTIKQDIVYAYKKNVIDLSFIEAITSDSLNYLQRMEYINNYENKEWKNVTNSTAKPEVKFGFN